MPESHPPKTKITLKIPGSSSSPVSSSVTPTATAPPLPPMPLTTSPAVETPSSAESGGTKIKLLGAGRKPLPSAAPPDSVSDSVSDAAPGANAMPPPPLPTPSRRKTGRVTKPSAKKRAKDETADDGEGGSTIRLNGSSTASAEPKAKRIKVVKTAFPPGKAPTLKLKGPGRIPVRPLGDGYDSEAEDREEDPTIEEQFVLRMPPGEHCDIIRKAVQERKVGLPRHQGGPDLSLKWVDDEGRRCMVTVQGQAFAAVLVDLPTVTEGMKTWDKKSLVKSADVCQMLLAFRKAAGEDDVRTAELPRVIDKGFRWPHGLTPPMHDCIHRRFRKRLSKLEIQNKEAEVERLLKLDQEAASTRWEFVDDRLDEARARQGSQPGVEEEEEEDEEEEADEEDEEMRDDDADAEGDVDDFFGDTGAGADDLFEVDDALLEAEFEAQVSGAMGEPAVTAAVDAEATTPLTLNTGTPAAQTDASGVEDEALEYEVEGDDEHPEEDGDDDEESDEDEDDNGGVDDDDEDGARHDEVAAVRNEITHLKKQLADLQGQLLRSVQPIMKRRIEQNIKNLKVELELKRSSIGDVDDD